MDTRQAATVGAQIRQARKRKHWTVKQLAIEAGVAANTVMAMENGRAVRPGNLRAVLDALGIPPLADVKTEHEADEDVALAQSIISQWLRRQDANTRARMIRDLMAMVTRSGE